MDVSKIQVGLLEGKSNWSTWKYKICIVLRSIPRAIDILEGKWEIPGIGSNPEISGDNAANEIKDFIKTESSTLIILTTNMTEEILKKIMRFNKAREIWLELHRLFDGTTEDKAYELCLQFFTFKKIESDDIGSHMSRLKNIWSQLKEEVDKDDNKDTFLDLFLICKILDTLPENYFSFKSSWLLMSKSERTIENLTNQLCAFERALNYKNKDSEDNKEVLLSMSNKNNHKNKKQDIVCHYCKKIGHIVRHCNKWKADGRPRKPKYL